MYIVYIYKFIKKIKKPYTIIRVHTYNNDIKRLIRIRIFRGGGGDNDDAYPLHRRIFRWIVWSRRIDHVIIVFTLPGVRAYYIIIYPVCESQ